MTVIYIGFAILAIGIIALERKMKEGFEDINYHLKQIGKKVNPGVYPDDYSEYDEETRLELLKEDWLEKKEKEQKTSSKPKAKG